ncbi:MULTISPECIES: MarR family winged helix-turn-helix transcriptional regulator [Pseudovibrio]|uniref:MarR family winged helix-turn-helix transcriptional regulator n=1 Tax=Stappiaceae TaxID=2821832 RepID=UPI002366B1FA|nr:MULTISPECIES: MarR family transcriptional regulator [Pseudovibrio]MDD7911460.1 MarR family transcriptional regulator [Pseudovibrio exalbescens]MDX5594225.1 MarR family transcriptional regulator [Pseudovibrio sp. SPO723]
MAIEHSDRIFKSIRRIVRAIDLRSREVARASGLTIPQIVVLQGINDLGEVTSKTLAQHADLSSATIVTILDALEKKQLVERYRSGKDRRIVHTRLTNDGTAVLQSAPALLHEDFKDELAQCSEADREALCAAIEQIAEMMNAHKLDASAILTVASVPK